MKDKISMSIERDKEALVYSKEGEKKENTVVFTFHLTQEDQRPETDALIKVRSVTFRYYEGFALLSQCQDMEYIPQTIKETKAEEIQADPPFIYAKNVLLTNQKVPGTFSITVKKIVTTLTVPGVVVIQVNLSDGSSLPKEFSFTKNSGQARILDFYPEYGAVYAGGKGRLAWAVEAAQGLKLTNDSKTEIPIPAGESSVEVVLSQTTEYTLQLLPQEGTAVSQVAEEQLRKTKIQVLPLYLHTFCLTKDRTKTMFQVFCAKEIRMNGEICMTEPSITEILLEGKDKMLLEATDGSNRMISTLYTGTNSEEEIALFRKTILLQQGLLILRVNWQNLSLARQSLRAVFHSSLQITDHKTGITDVFYQSQTADAKEHEWEMLLRGHTIEQVNTEVTVTMQMQTVGGDKRTITL